MLTRLHLSAILIVAALVWGLALVVAGVSVDAAWLHPFSTVVGVCLLVLVSFDLWLWRLRLLSGWFVPRPDIRGTWRVELQSTWKQPATGENVPPIDAFLVVRQTFSSLSVRLITAESSSELVGSEITKAGDGTYRVAGVYRNEPRLSVRERSAIHYGALVLGVLGDPAGGLEGHYWTDRDTRGEIRSTDHDFRIVTSFEEGGALLAKP